MAAPELSRFLVHSQDVNGPACHALVIGVSDYPYLNEGSGTLTRQHEGMGQLTSPTPSAHQFASWLIKELHDPAKPLATVALLVSDPERTSFRNPKTLGDCVVESATIDNAKRAIREWSLRGQGSEDRLIMYFCGHGLANGLNPTLLLSDYGAEAADALEGAIDFNGLWLGLDNVAARQQVFFIDACRANARTTLRANGYLGHPIIRPDIAELRMPAPPPRQAPIYFSTLAGELAYGFPGRATPFTEALIRSLAGHGSNNNEGDWRVNTVGLKFALDFFMERAFDGGLERAQVPSANNLSTFDLHYLSSAPESLVFVGCRPEAANTVAEFSYLSRGQLVDRRAPGPGDWELRLPPGEYEFCADFEDAFYRRTRRNWLVMPPFSKVPLEVL